MTEFQISLCFEFKPTDYFFEIRLLFFSAVWPTLTESERKLSGIQLSSFNFWRLFSFNQGGVF